jgi:hypothetical protein
VWETKTEDADHKGRNLNCRHGHLEVRPLPGNTGQKDALSHKTDGCEGGLFRVEGRSPDGSYSRLSKRETDDPTRGGEEVDKSGVRPLLSRILLA